MATGTPFAVAADTWAGFVWLATGNDISMGENGSKSSIGQARMVATKNKVGRRTRDVAPAAPPRPSAPLIDTAEAAALLGVTPRFVRRLVDERRIPFHKIGKFVRFDPADIDSFAMTARVETLDHMYWPRSR